MPPPDVNAGERVWAGDVVGAGRGRQAGGQHISEDSGLTIGAHIG